MHDSVAAGRVLQNAYELHFRNCFIEMLTLQASLLLFLATLAFVEAHKQPQSEQEREIQRALQAAAYHVIIPVD